MIDLLFIFKELLGTYSLLKGDTEIRAKSFESISFLVGKQPRAKIIPEYKAANIASKSSGGRIILPGAIRPTSDYLPRLPFPRRP